MDFYSRQEQARKQTRWLVLAFIVAMLLVAAALDLVLFAAFSFSNPEVRRFAPLQYAADRPGVALFCTLLVLGVIGLIVFGLVAESFGYGGLATVVVVGALAFGVYRFKSRSKTGRS